MSRQAMQPPCSASDIENLKRRSADELGYAIPAEYAHFLGVTNGLVWNGLSLYASETAPLKGLPNANAQGFVDANVHYRSLRQGDPMHDYIIFGEDGTVFFTYHIPTDVFEVVTIVGMTVLEKYNTFSELVLDALRGHV